MIVRQHYMKKILDYVDSPIIKVIKGIRRCGKTEILKMIIRSLKDKGIDDSRIVYINYESFASMRYKDFISLYEYVKERAASIDNKIYVFLDEIQEVEFWEKAVRSIRVDFECDIYITGSNAHLLSGELATLLSGRYVEFEIMPLSYEEFVDFYSDLMPQAVENDFFRYYLRIGGFPDLINIKQKEEVIYNYLNSIYDTVVLRDVIERGNIRNPELLKRILIYMMDNIGQMTSGARIISYLKGANHEKVSTTSLYRYIEGLEEAMIIYSVKPYDVKGKKLLTRSEKFYLSDLGLRHARLGYKENDISQLLENIVYLELRRLGYEIHVGKIGEYEVDFVIQKADDIKYIQVTYSMDNEKTLEREYRALEKISDNYDKYILTMDQRMITGRGGVKCMYIVEFLKNGFKRD